MANSWFKFKQFSIQQDQCAMKVGTDGVLLGAWTKVENAHRILDVGTGTGLIAIMLAQRNPKCTIDAIEIETKAAQQAQNNITLSPFGNRIKVYEVSYQIFSEKNMQKYDLIVSNPPFFNNSFLSDSKSRNMARQTKSLNYIDLIKLSYKNLSKTGCLSVIIPSEELDSFSKISEENGLYLTNILKVYPTLKKNYRRVLLNLKKQIPKATKENKIVIEPTQRHLYSKQYKDLVKDFYLKL